LNGRAEGLAVREEGVLAGIARTLMGTQPFYAGYRAIVRPCWPRSAAPVGTGKDREIREIAVRLSGAMQRQLWEGGAHVLNDLDSSRMAQRR